MTRAAAVACLALATVLVFRAAAGSAGAEPSPIRGGSFEPSGVVHVRGTGGVLFVDDGRNREILWMELNDDGTQRSAVIPVKLDADVTDLEGITSDGRYVYVVGSQSKRDGVDGDGLVRFRYDPATRTTTDVERIRGVRAWLAREVAELKGADRRGKQGLNIEALAWDPRANRLLLGLRTPIVDGDGLVVALTPRDRSGPFTTGNFQAAPNAIRLSLGGAGIRSLEYDDHAGAFRLIADDGGNGNEEFRIAEWDGRAATITEHISSYARSLQPEGITRATLGGRPVSVVVFDTSRFLVTD